MVKKRKADRDTERALTAYRNLVRAVEWVNVLLVRQLDSFGLTMGQFRALEALRQGRTLSPKELAKHLGCGPANIACVLRNLEGMGLVLRRENDRDRRGWAVRLTPEGQERIEKVFPHHATLVRAQMKALSNREQEALKGMCWKLWVGNPIRLVRELMKIE